MSKSIRKYLHRSNRGAMSAPQTGNQSTREPSGAWVATEYSLSDAVNHLRRFGAACLSKKYGLGGAVCVLQQQWCCALVGALCTELVVSWVVLVVVLWCCSAVGAVRVQQWWIAVVGKLG